MAIVIQRLEPAHAERYRALMLQAYAAHPDAFTSSADERAALPMAWWHERLSAPAGAERVFGALVDGALAGAAGLSFEPRAKARHKATLFGMYVAPAYRGTGAGRALVLGLLDHARGVPGLRQVLLTVTRGNAAAQALYEGCGFSVFGIEPRAVNIDGVFMDKVHMWCDLYPTPPSTGQEPA